VTDAPPTEYATLNRFGHMPFFVDRAIALWGEALLTYFEERFPAPQLMPTDAVPRAQTRALANTIRDWYQLASSEDEAVRCVLPVVLGELNECYEPEQFWIAGNSMSIVDVAVVPLLHFAHAKGQWDPAGTRLARYYATITATPAFQQAVLAARRVEEVHDFAAA
jgi:glutathione S-transferase